MINLIAAAALILAGCFFGSILDFSEQNVEGKINEIFNSGFEEGQFETDLMPLGWTALSNGEHCISTDEEVYYSGGRSLKINKTTSKCSIISESFPLDPRGIYFSRCFLKTNYQSNHAVEIMFIAFDAKGKQVNKYKTTAYPQENWSKAMMSTGYFKPNARFGRIVITFPGRKDKVFWLDDVETYNVHSNRN